MKHFAVLALILAFSAVLAIHFQYVRPFLNPPSTSFSLDPINADNAVAASTGDDLFEGWSDILNGPQRPDPIDFKQTMARKKRPIWILAENHQERRAFEERHDKSPYGDYVSFDPFFLMETDCMMVGGKLAKSIERTSWAPIDSPLLVLLTNLMDCWRISLPREQLDAQHTLTAMYLRSHQDTILNMPEIDREDLAYLMDPTPMSKDQYRRFAFMFQGGIKQIELGLVDHSPYMDVIYEIGNPKRREASTEERLMASWRLFLSVLNHYLAGTKQNHSLLSKMGAYFGAHSFSLDVKSLHEEQDARRLLIGTLQQMIQQALMKPGINPREISSGLFLLGQRQLYLAGYTGRLLTIIAELRSYFFARKALEFHGKESDVTRPFVLICGKLHALPLARILKRSKQWEVRMFTVNPDPNNDPALEDIGKYVETRNKS